MKLLTGLLAAMLLLAGVGTSHALVRIANDRGGQIGRYVESYEQLRASGQTVGSMAFAPQPVQLSLARFLTIKSA